MMENLPKSHACSRCTFCNVQKNFSKREHSRLLPFSQKTKKKFTGLEMQSSCRSGFLFGRKGSSLGGSKIFLDLFRNHPATHPLSSHRCADAPFPAAGAKSLRPLAMNSRLPFPGPPAIRPGRKGKLTTCLFCQLFSRTISCTPSECVVLNERRIGKSCKRNNVNWCLVLIHLKKSLKSELAADTSQAASIPSTFQILSFLRWSLLKCQAPPPTF